MKANEHALDMETLMSYQFKDYQEEVNALLKYYTPDEAVERCNRRIETIQKLRDGITDLADIQTDQEYAGQQWDWHTIRYMILNWKGA